MTDTAPSPIDLPPPLRRLEFRHLFALELSVDPLQAIGPPDGPLRRVGPIAAGRFAGSRISGRVTPGGADWQTVSGDGATQLDARLVLQTEAGDLIGMMYSGLRHGPAEVMDRLARGQPVDPAAYYFRIMATFSTASSTLDWLNRILAVGAGHRLPAGPVYNLFEVA